MEGMEVASASVTPDTGSAMADSGTQDAHAGDTKGAGGVQKEAAKGASKSVQEKAEDLLGESDLSKKVRVKINGQEKVMTVKEVIKLQQLEQASHEKMRTAAQLEKQVKGFVEFLKANPKAAMQQLGVDPYEFAEMTLAEKLEAMSMSPEQRELSELKAWKAEQERQEKLRQEHEEQQKMTRAETAEAERLDKELADAFSTSGLPKHKLYVMHVADLMRTEARRGNDLSAREAVSIIKDKVSGLIREAVGSLDADAIRALLGDETVKKLRESELRKVTAGAAPTTKSSSVSLDADGTEKRVSKPKASKYVNEKGYRAYLEQLKSGS